MFSRSDYVMRLVEQLAEALARVLKLRKAGQEAGAQQAARDACGDLLGIEFSVLQMLDATRATANSRCACSTSRPKVRKTSASR